MTYMKKSNTLMDAICLAMDEYERTKDDQLEYVLRDYVMQYIEYKFNQHSFKFPGKFDEYYIRLLSELIS